MSGVDHGARVASERREKGQGQDAVHRSPSDHFELSGPSEMARDTILSYVNIKLILPSHTHTCIPSPLPAAGVAPSHPEVGGGDGEMGDGSIRGQSVTV